MTFLWCSSLVLLSFLATTAVAWLSSLGIPKQPHIVTTARSAGLITFSVRHIAPVQSFLPRSPFKLLNLRNGKLFGNASGEGNSLSPHKCSKCTGSGAVNCGVCAGTGIDKINGNVFERWTCTTCKGFGYVACPSCSSGPKKGLTPEQRCAYWRRIYVLRRGIYFGG